MSFRKLVNSAKEAFGKFDGNLQMMIMMPVMTSMTNSAVKEVNHVLHGVILLIKNTFAFLLRILYTHYINRINKVHKLYVQIKRKGRYSSSSESITTNYGRAIIWFFNTKVKKPTDKALLIDSEIEGGIVVNMGQAGNIVPYTDLEQQDAINNIKNDGQMKNKIDHNSGMDNNVIIVGDIEIKIYFDGGVKENLYAIFSSKKKTVKQLQNFVLKIKDDYNASQQTKRSLPGVMTYTRQPDGCNTFNMIKYELDTTQTFDSLFFDGKEELIRQLDEFNDLEVWKNKKMKRKIGYLFHGQSGAGKTCIITAIANYLGRTIIYIPLSQVTNATLQRLIYQRSYNWFNYKMDEVIFCFDEIDSYVENLQKKKDKVKKKKAREMKKKKEELKATAKNVTGNNCSDSDSDSDSDDENGSNDIDIGMVLNTFDGNMNLDGLVVTATAYNLENLDQGIIRPGRFEGWKCKYMGKQNILETLNYHGYTDIPDRLANKIPDTRNVYSLTIKKEIDYCVRKNIPMDKTIGRVVDLFSTDSY